MQICFFGKKKKKKLKIRQNNHQRTIVSKKSTPALPMIQGRRGQSWARLSNRINTELEYVAFATIAEANIRIARPSVVPRCHYIFNFMASFFGGKKQKKKTTKSK